MKSDLPHLSIRVKTYAFDRFTSFAILWNALLSLQLVAAEYSIRTWTVENGLPQNRVTCIAQTPEGYLWLGTEVGLTRFDGVQFELQRPEITPGLPLGGIVDLFVDGSGRLWVSGDNGFLGYLAEGTFSTIERDPHHAPTIRAMALDAADNLHLWDAHGQAYLWSEAKPFKQSSIPVPWFAKNEAGYPSPLAAWDCDSKSLFVGMRNELYCRYRGQWNRLMPRGNTRPGFQRPWIDAMAPSHDGGVWVAGEYEIHRFVGPQFVETIDLPWATPARTGALWETANGTLWIGSHGAGLFHHDFASGATAQIDTRIFTADTILALHGDHEGNLWVGTEWGGLARIKPKDVQSIQSLGSVFPVSVTSIAEDSSGHLWAGTDGDGLYRIDDSRTHSYLDDPPFGIRSVIVDRQDQVWVGAVSLATHGLYRIPAAGDISSVQRINDSESQMIINTLFEDSNGLIWIGTQQGLFTCEPHGPSSVEPFRLESHPARFRFEDIRAIAESATGDLWFGTKNRGLYRLPRSGDSRSPQLGSLQIINAHSDLPDDNVWSLYIDSHDDVWIGTFGGGLCRYRNGTLASYREDSGLPATVITSILEYDSEYWLSSNRGILRIPRSSFDAYDTGIERSLTWKAFGTTEGIPSLECSGGVQPTTCVTRSGDLWFSTQRGLATIRPSSLPKNPAPPILIIESITIDDESPIRLSPPNQSDSNPCRLLDGEQPPAVHSDSKPGEEPNLEPTRIEIPPGPHRIEINYTCLSYAQPEQVQFKYRLEGYDSEWTFAGTRRVAYYNKIPPGSYRFKVAATNSDGVWNAQGAVLAISALPHLWQTTWFLVGTAGIASLCLIMLVRYMAQRRLRWQMLHLERETAVAQERARIAHDMHDDLGARLTQIALQGELIQRAASGSNELTEKIAKVTRTARETTSALDEIVWAVNPKNDNLDRLAAYLVHYSRDYCDSVGLPISIHVPSTVPSYPLTGEQRHHLFLCVKEALNNIVKHAEATHVELALSADDSILSIKIRDNGRGFRSSESKVFGNGIESMTHRLQSSNGSVDFHSKPGEGTEITINLPLANDS